MCVSFWVSLLIQRFQNGESISISLYTSCVISVTAYVLYLIVGIIEAMFMKLDQNV